MVIKIPSVLEGNIETFIKGYLLGKEVWLCLDSATSFNLINKNFVEEFEGLSRRLVNPFNLSTALGNSCFKEGSSFRS